MMNLLWFCWRLRVSPCFRGAPTWPYETLTFTDIINLGLNMIMPKRSKGVQVWPALVVCTTQTTNCPSPEGFGSGNKSLFKVPMKWKIICAYLKALSKYRRMLFFFLKYLFSFYRYRSFYIMHIGLQLKYWINDISGNIEAVFLKLGTTNVHQKRNKKAPSAVAMTTVLPLVLC